MKNNKNKPNADPNQQKSDKFFYLSMTKFNLFKCILKTDLHQQGKTINMIMSILKIKKQPYPVKCMNNNIKLDKHANHTCSAQYIQI